MTSCAILFFFSSFLFFFVPFSVNRTSSPTGPSSFKQRDRFKGFTGGIFDFLLLDLEPPHRPTLSTPNLPALLFSLLGLLKTRKSRNREACSERSFIRTPLLLVIQWILLLSPLARSLPLSTSFSSL